MTLNAISHLCEPRQLIPGDDDLHLSASAAIDRQLWGNGSAHPAKRQRILACRRCRGRKQKCDGDGENPCSNCTRADERCVPTEPAGLRARYKADYVQSLEERLGQLERLMPENAVPVPQNLYGEISPQERFDVRQRAHDRHQPSSTPENISNTEETYQQPAICGSPVCPRGNWHDQTREPAYRSSTTAQFPSNHAIPPQSNHSQSSASTVSQSISSPLQPIASPENESHISNTSQRSTVLATLPHIQNTHQNNHSTGPGERRASLETYLNHLAVWPDTIPEPVEEHLINIYFENANVRWPFLLKRDFCSWYAKWKRSLDANQECKLWEGFFVNMLFAVSLLLDPKNPTIVLYTSQNFYGQAVNHYLPLVLRHQNRLLHVQAYLMMSLHALFSPSTDQIALMISATVRYCVVSQFHLVEAEPVPKTTAAQIEIQMRRRAFWVTYGLDRLACGVLRLPYSISDESITVPLFQNIDDDSLAEGCLESSGPLAHTSVSSALHRERLFLIQSEILNATARCDFSANIESFATWRGYILSKLDHWRSNLQKAADCNSKRPTDERWILITYNLCLLLLHMPTKTNVCGPAGDWALRASLQIIMIFRKFQSYKTIPHPWLGLINQFSVGITMLYCLWATPPQSRTDAYNSKNILEAVRGCSNNLAIIAERWERAKDLLDVFELLATEVPLVEIIPSSDNGPQRAINRIRSEIADEIQEKLSSVQSIVLNSDTFRMIKEMTSEDLPTHVECQAPAAETGQGLEHQVDTGPILTGQAIPNGLSGYPFFGSYVSEDRSVNQMENISLHSFEFPANFPGYELF